MSIPLVYTEDGAVLGPDFRRSELSTVDVPGWVRADQVYPGDTALLGGSEVLVVSTRHHGAPGTVYLFTRTVGGAEVVHEIRESEYVHVTAVGAFEPKMCPTCGRQVPGTVRAS